MLSRAPFMPSDDPVPSEVWRFLVAGGTEPLPCFFDLNPKNDMMIATKALNHMRWTEMADCEVFGGLWRSGVQGRWVQPPTASMTLERVPASGSIDSIQCGTIHQGYSSIPEPWLGWMAMKKSWQSKNGGGWFFFWQLAAAKYVRTMRYTRLGWWNIPRENWGQIKPLREDVCYGCSGRSLYKKNLSRGSKHASNDPR